MSRIVVLALLALCFACGPVDQPDSIRYAAAVELPPINAADRSDLVAMLRRHAAGRGLHVDDVSESRRRFQQDMPQLPAMARGTIYIGLWRGDEDDELIALVDDTDHRGRPWVIFFRGTQPALAMAVREGLLGDIRRRWPDARSLPVLPWGGLPLAEDLSMTPAGYKIVRSAAARYGLPAASPLLVPR